MCGIVGGFNIDIRPGLALLHHRGPDAQGLITRGSLSLGHTRLAIIDLHPRANQPLVYNQITLAFNGAVWNYKELREQLEQEGFTFNTESDTEVFAALLSRDGVDALSKLEGMFAAAWVDSAEEVVYLARDRFGEIPLHLSLGIEILFASEIKALLELDASPETIRSVPPGHYAVLTEQACHFHRYYDIPVNPLEISPQDAATQLYRHLDQAVIERLNSDVPICTLLSGGIDSACITYFLSQHIDDLVAYTAVHDLQSEDLKAARVVAEALNIELREVSIPAPTAEQISRVIWHIEMSYKSQIEIGWPCLVLAEQIQKDGFRVIFSGDGSDELWASYYFAQKALETEDWYRYRKELFLLQERKNFARANKIFMAHGIECRLPFLNTALVEFALSLPRHVVQQEGQWKAIIQHAFEGKLPESITSRPKMAFQNGLKIKQAIAAHIDRPRKFYHDEHKRFFG